MGTDLVAPVVGWLAHETCAVSGEMLVSMGGRVARAFIAETEGLYRPSWTIDEVADNIEAIRDLAKLWILHPVEAGLSGENAFCLSLRFHKHCHGPRHRSGERRPERKLRRATQVF